MFIEIAIPHFLPMILIIIFGIRRCYDRRSCRSNHGKSR